MDDPRTFDRHIDTLAALNVVAAVALAGTAAWLVGGLHASVSRDERRLRLWGAAILILLAVLFGVIWLALQWRWRGGQLAQIAAAVVLLPLVPVGTLWGGYALWVLAKPGTRARFAPGAARPVGIRPYPGAVLAAVSLSVVAVVAIPVRVREAWLAYQVTELSRTAAVRGENISDQSMRLRQAGLIDGDNSERRDHR